MARKHLHRMSRTQCAHAAALIMAAGPAAPAIAVDKSWNSDLGNWTEAASWFPVGVPNAADRVFIGNVAGVQNTWVTLNQNATVVGLQITDGMGLDTGDFRFDANGDISVSGRNSINTEFGPVSYRSTFRVDDAIVGVDCETHAITLSNEARLWMASGTIRATEAVTVGAGCSLDGDGVIQLAGAGTTLVNNGTISPGIWGPIILSQTAGGAFDLDGSTGDGELYLDRLEQVQLTIQGGSITDSFSGTIYMVSDSNLHVNVDGGWATDSASLIRVPGGFSDMGPRISGTELTIGGRIDVSGNNAQLDLDCPNVFATTADVAIGADDVIIASRPSTLDGGEFALDDGAERFANVTTVHAGVFNTFSDHVADGYVAFNAYTVWDGDVTINGVVRQNGLALVAGSSVIDAGVFDMDGAAPHDWYIEAGLTINAASVDTAGNSVDGAIYIGGGIPSRLTVNLDNPIDAWVIAGELNLASTAGALTVTRIAGSPLSITGDVNVTSGRNNITARTTFGSSASVNIGPANAELRMMAPSLIFPSTTFEGAGMLVNGPAGDMTLLSGASTGAVGLINLGLLRIGGVSGIASVDRFQTTGAWEVEIGGYNAGTEYDRLIVSGGAATVGGTLIVQLVDEDADGVTFHPVVGDSFTILTAVGGVNGAFPANVVSMADGWTYQWAVESNPNDVTLRVVGATPPPCVADFNEDGVVNSQDFFDFLSRFFIQSERADVNADGVVNSQDFFDFLVMFFKGC